MPSKPAAVPTPTAIELGSAPVVQVISTFGKVITFGEPSPLKVMERATGPATVPLAAPVEESVGLATVTSQAFAAVLVKV